MTNNESIIYPSSFKKIYNDIYPSKKESHNKLTKIYLNFQRKYEKIISQILETPVLKHIYSIPQYFNLISLKNIDKDIHIAQQDIQHLIKELEKWEKYRLSGTFEFLYKQIDEVIHDEGDRENFETIKQQIEGIYESLNTHRSKQNLGYQSTNISDLYQLKDGNNKLTPILHSDLLKIQKKIINYKSLLNKLKIQLLHIMKMEIKYGIK